jgi:predicted RNA-binding Zn-ribbon protein involved in translation (DUF1610 family)
MSERQQNQPQKPSGSGDLDDRPDNVLQAFEETSDVFATSSQEIVEPGTASTGYVCPLCGTITRSQIYQFRRHLRNMHPKALYSCGYCCEVFTVANAWAWHVAESSQYGDDWLVVNQVLGIIRHTLSTSSKAARQAHISRITNTLPALQPLAGVAALNDLLPRMESEFPVSTDLLTQAIQHLKANQVCTHQIVDEDYVISPDSELCMVCGQQHGETRSAATLVKRNVCPLTTPTFLEVARDPSRVASPQTCHTCHLTLDSLHDLDRHITEQHSDPELTCPTCKKKYKSKEILDAHTKMSHNLPRTLCPVESCPFHDKGFSQPYALIRHMRNKHPDYQDSQDNGQ